MREGRERTARWAALLAVRPGPPAPPGVDPDAWRLALVEDGVDVLSTLVDVRMALALAPGDQDDVVARAWPGTPLLRLDAGSSGDGPGLTAAALAGLHDLGGDAGVVVAADAPDLPGLLLAKLFRALGRSQAAVCPADGGGLVALGARLPPPAWVAAARVGLDTSDALARLARAAPDPAALSVGPGWHRLRKPTDLARLDPGLEGWPATRALLGPAG